MLGGREFLSTVLLVDGLQTPFDEAGVPLSRNYFVEREIKRGGERLLVEVGGVRDSPATGL